MTNEWDVIHSKGETYIKNLSNEISSWGQDTYSETGYRSVRGKNASADHWDYIGSGGADKIWTFPPCA